MLIKLLLYIFMLLYLSIFLFTFVFTQIFSSPKGGSREQEPTGKTQDNVYETNFPCRSLHKQEICIDTPSFHMLFGYLYFLVNCLCSVKRRKAVGNLLHLRRHVLNNSLPLLIAIFQKRTSNFSQDFFRDD